MVQNNAEKYLCIMSKMNGYHQESRLISAIPLGVNRIYVDRMVNTEAVALFIPSEAQEMNEAHGLCYGVNETLSIPQQSWGESYTQVAINRVPK